MTTRREFFRSALRAVATAAAMVYAPSVLKPLIPGGTYIPVREWLHSWSDVKRHWMAGDLDYHHRVVRYTRENEITFRYADNAWHA